MPPPINHSQPAFNTTSIETLPMPIPLQSDKYHQGSKPKTHERPQCQSSTLTSEIKI